jgi:hypothetical protein
MRLVSSHNLLFSDKLAQPVLHLSTMATREKLTDMNRRAMLSVANRYALLLEAHGAVVRRADLDRNFSTAADRMVLLNHARWQLEMVDRLIDRVGGLATAIRLLGSAQGILIALGLITVGDTSRDNREWLDGASIRAFDSAVEELARLSTY